MTVQVQLLGRTTTPPRTVSGRGISPLWDFFLPPSSQHSILIYNDGSVVEGEAFENDEIKDPDVHTYIYGGTDYRTDVGTFEYNALTAAGYTWRNVYTSDVYAETYDTQYD